MSALVYLAFKKGKNKLYELLHKPFKLILTFGFVLLLVMNFSLSQNSPSGDRPLDEFRAIILAFYTLCFVTEAKKGFRSGGSMFSLADVNLLFTSPLKPVVILFNGMLSRLSSSLFMGVAFVYQFALLRSYYPITVRDMLTAVVGYGAVVFVSQLAGMLIYSFTCGEEEKIKKAKLAFYSVCAAFLLAAVIAFISSGIYTFYGFSLAFICLPMRLFPVAGWIFTAVDGFMHGDMLKLTLGFLPCIVFTASAFALLAFSKKGYYEDAVLSAVKNENVKNDGGAAVNVKVKKGGKGLEKGQGASVFFHVHMLENRRTKTSLLSPTSLFYLIFIAVYGFAFDGGLFLLFFLSCTVSFLPVLSGKWLKELSMPYIHLVPEQSAKKLFYILSEMIVKVFAESVLQGILIAFICRLGAGVTVALIAARLSVSFVLIATALLIARLFREKEKNSVFLAMSVFPGMLFLVPSMLLFSAVLSFGMGLTFAFTSMMAVNLLVAPVLLFFARNIFSVA